MLSAVVGLTCGTGSRLASLDAASELLAAAAEAESLRGSRIYTVASAGETTSTLASALRLTYDGELDALRGRIDQVRSHLSLEGAPADGSLFAELLWVGAGTEGLDGAAHHPDLWWCTHALAPLLDVAPELAETFELSLGWAGGPPPAEPWAHVWGRGIEVAEYSDRAAATAGAAMWRALQLGTPQARPDAVRDWDPTPDGDDLGEALAQLDTARAEGFQVRTAVVLDTSGPRWRGRLYGVQCTPEEVKHRPLRLQLQPRNDGIGLKLQR